MNKIRLLVFLLISLALGLRAYSQGEANIWYVGNNIKMDFSGGGDPVVSNGITIGGDLTENSTAISDANGDLLFAVVGNRVYDGAQNPDFALPTTTWDVSQGTIVFPVPGTTDKYYLCVMQKGTGATTPMSTYYEVTVTGTGANNISVVAAGNLLPNLTEAQAGVPKVNPDFSVSDDYWLITHEKCNNDFEVFSVTASGISLSSTESTGPQLVCDASFPPQYDEIGVMKFNSCYTQMAYTIGGRVQLYDFDAQTGGLTFINEITNLSQPYGLEFSNDGSFLYVLIGQDNTVPGKIYSIPVGAGGLGAANDLGSSAGMRGGHLQIAPDGNIYYAVPQAFGNAGRGQVGRIVDADNGGVLENDFYTATKQVFGSSDEDQWVNMDMPTFLKSLVSSIATLKINGETPEANSVCLGETVDFEIEIDGQGVAGVQWNASGSNTATQTGGEQFSMTMNNAGLTTITVEVTDDCGRSRDLEFEIDVVDYVDADATVDLSTCPNQTLTGTSTNSSVTDYEWYDGDPNNGGNLLSIGPDYQYTGSGDVWVQATGKVESFTDSRAGANFGNAGNTTVIVNEEINIAEVKFEAYSFSASFAGQNWTVELVDAGGSVVGNPVTGTLTGPQSEIVTVKGDGWNNLAPGTYTLRYSGAWNFVETVSGAYNGGGKISAVGGSFFGILAQQIETLPCVTATQVNVGACCNVPDDITITQGAAADLCAGNDLTLTTNTQANTSDYLFAWFKDADPTIISNGGTQAGNVNKLDYTVSNPNDNTTDVGGTYTIIVVDKNEPTSPSCRKTASIDITDLSAPTASNAGSAATVCADNTTLAGNAVATGETGEWTVVSGSGTFTDANDPTTTVTGIGTGDNVYK
ncbi:MAG: hypothetical protein GY827_11880, partial [Cytophagales bacterium]|nr:hypothetical protein [Cytophagales bacterium]